MDSVGDQCGSGLGGAGNRHHQTILPLADGTPDLLGRLRESLMLACML
jgi:hypothetical protein